MATHQSPDDIRQAAKQLDDAVEQKDVETVLSCFADDGEVQLGGVTLHGKEGLQRGLAWLYDRLGAIKFQPVTILVEGNTFFEEFVMKTRKEPGHELQITAAEVLVYEGGKVKSLRVYLDRLALARAVATGIVEKWIVRKLDQLSLRGLQ